MSLNGISKLALKKLVINIEGLNNEIDEIRSQLSDSFKEAKKLGFDVPVLRKLIGIRKKKQLELFEKEQLLDMYKEVLDMVDGEEIPEIKLDSKPSKKPHPDAAKYNPDKFHTSGTELEKEAAGDTAIPPVEPNPVSGTVTSIMVMKGKKKGSRKVGKKAFKAINKI